MWNNEIFRPKMGTSALDILDIGEELSEDADVTSADGGAALLLDGSEDGGSGHVLSLPSCSGILKHSSKNISSGVLRLN